MPPPCLLLGVRHRRTELLHEHGFDFYHLVRVQLLVHLSPRSARMPIERRRLASHDGERGGSRTNAIEAAQLVHRLPHRRVRVQKARHLLAIRLRGRSHLTAWTRRQQRGRRRERRARPCLLGREPAAHAGMASCGCLAHRRRSRRRRFRCHRSQQCLRLRRASSRRPPGGIKALVASSTGAASIVLHNESGHAARSWPDSMAAATEPPARHMKFCAASWKSLGPWPLAPSWKSDRPAAAQAARLVTPASETTSRTWMAGSTPASGPLDCRSTAST